MQRDDSRQSRFRQTPTNNNQSTMPRRLAATTSPRRLNIEALETRVMFAAAVPFAVDNDLAVDSAGNVHLAYFDDASRTLKYMVQSAGGNWSSPMTIDPA